MRRFFHIGLIVAAVIGTITACATPTLETVSTAPQMVDLKANDTIMVYLPDPNGTDASILNAIGEPLVDLDVTQKVLGAFKPDRILIQQATAALASKLGQSDGLVFSTTLSEPVAAR